MADRRKEQNKKAQQRFREKRQKEVEELKSSLRSLKDEMSSLQSALDAAQKENSLLKSELDKKVHTSAAKDCSAATDDQGTSFLDFLNTEDHASHGWLDEAVGMEKPNSPQIAPVTGPPGFFFDQDEAGDPLFREAASAAGEGDSQVINVGQNDNTNTTDQNTMCSNMVLDSPPTIGVDSSKRIDYGVIHENGRPWDPTFTIGDDVFPPPANSEGINGNSVPMLDVPQSAPEKDANYYIPSLSLSSNVPETGWTMAASSDSGTRLMYLFSQLLNLEYARIANLNHTQGIF